MVISNYSLFDIGDQIAKIWSDSGRWILSLDSSGAFQDQFGHFWVNKDVTVAIRNRIWWFFLQLSIFLTWEIILSKYEVILTIRSRVWTRAAHSRTNLVIFESIVTLQWQSEPEFDDFFPSFRFFWHGVSYYQSLTWFWQVDPQEYRPCPFYLKIRCSVSDHRPWPHLISTQHPDPTSLPLNSLTLLTSTQHPDPSHFHSAPWTSSLPLIMLTRLTSSQHPDPSHFHSVPWHTSLPLTTLTHLT